MFRDRGPRILITLIILCSLLRPLAAELFIVKIMPNGTIAPLQTSSLSNKQQTTLYNIMMKHQWPNNTAFAFSGELSHDIQQRLFAHQPAAEEAVIRELIQKDIGSSYDIVFIPTVLYELFVLGYLFAKTSPSFAANARSIKGQWHPNNEQSIKTCINQTNTSHNDILNVFKYWFAHEKKGMWTLFKKLFSGNNVQHVQDAYMEINEQLGRYILDQKTCTHAQECCDYIQQQSLVLGYNVITHFALPNAKDSTYSHVNFSRLTQNLDATNSTLKADGFIAKTIGMEYEARTLNYGCLLRGTSIINHMFHFNDSSIQQAIDSTLNIENIASFDAFLETYKQKKLLPRSISYGNSLFAASLQDAGACSYEYFTYSNDPANIGYGLLIDKEAYVANECDNLFFVSPLPTLVALFAIGAYFHSRSKAAIFSDPAQGSKLIGIYEEATLKDAAHLFLIQREPLLHELIFSRYLAQHARILKQPQATGTTYADALRAMHAHIADVIAKQQPTIT